MKNLTKCYTVDEIKDNIHKYAKEFSEGNVYLEKLLLFCFENNITTKACCSGHKKEEGNICDSGAYILFVISREQVDLISNAINTILTSLLGDKCSFDVIPKFDKEDIYYEVIFRLKREFLDYRDVFFSTILELIKQSNIYDKTNLYGDLFRLFDIFYENNLDLTSVDGRFDIEKNKPLSFLMSKIIFVEELNDETYATMDGIDGSNFIEYIESLKEIKDFSLDDLNNSFKLTFEDINKLCSLLNKLSERSKPR